MCSGCVWACRGQIGIYLESGYLVKCLIHGLTEENTFEFRVVKSPILFDSEMPRAARSAPKKPVVKKKGAKHHVLPETLPEGLILIDIRKKSWRLGPPIGTGGFGAVYAASEVDTNSDSYVIKIEPHGNGPLFVEMHFYMKFSNPEDVNRWMKDRKLAYLGVPQFHGHGSHEYNGTKYRFIVIDRFGRNVHSIFQKNKMLSQIATFQLGVQIINILEFIHSRGYCHADIKGDNLLLGCKKGSENQVFLIDFGLAEQCTKAKEKPDPKKAHNGTAEYTSRDAHRGVIAKRGDLEILAYNMLHWMSGKLPWEKDLGDCVKLAALKEEYMRDVPKLMKTCFGSSKPPEALVKFFNHVVKMDYSEIDYDKCRSICVDGLKKLKSGVDRPLDIDVSEEPKTVKSSAGIKGRKRRSDAGGSLEPLRKKAVVKDTAKSTTARKPAVSRKTKAAVSQNTKAEDNDHESSNNENVNGYIDVPDSPEPISKPLSRIRKKGPVNKRKSVVSSILATSLARRKSTGLKKRLSVVAKKVLPSTVKTLSWRDCPTIASSSKFTTTLTNRKSRDAPVKGRGRGRKVK